MNDTAGQNGHHVRGDSQRRHLLARVAGAATERIVDTVDPDIVLDHIDVDALVARIDVNAVLERVDIDRLVERIDLQSLVVRAGVPDLVAASTGRIAESGLDLVRRQVAGLDMVLARFADRLLRRPLRSVEGAPSRLRSATSDGLADVTVTGHYAGAVSRCLAALIDVLLVTGTYTLGLAAADYLLATLGIAVGDVSPVWSAIALGSWALAFVGVFTTVAGRTPGKSLLGLRVVRTDGTFVPVGRSVVRSLLWWPSTLVAGIAILPVILQRRHRALHDAAAGTCVVHDWGDRPAELPAPLSAFLRRTADVTA